MRNLIRLMTLIALMLSSSSLVIASSHAQTREAPLLRNGSIIRDRYIVVFKHQSNANTRLSTLANVTAEISQMGGSVHYEYDTALQGIAATLPPRAVEALRRNPSVAYIEADQETHVSDTQSPATWGIDRIDQRRLPLSNSYTYNYTGLGVNAYDIDTGIRETHVEFEGRASRAYDALGGNGSDCHGHGTHTAGTIGGKTYGVAKKVRIYAVRVLNCSGSGNVSAFIAGVDWVTRNHRKPAVANVSIIMGSSDTAANAVRNSIAAGVVYAVSANNQNTDACTTSPAKVREAITVGATTSSDARSGFSNYGTCVDLFAPGSGVTSAYHSSDTATTSMSGTSMAAPHAAGVAALYLQANPNATPAQVQQALVSSATPGVVTNPGPGSPNLLLYSLFSGTIPTLTPTPVTRTPTPVTPTPITVTPTPITPTPPTVTTTPVPGIIFSDNFESEKGWIPNPDGNDTATTGRWERGSPEPTNYNGAKQIAAASPSNDLVTGRLAGSNVGDYDVDGGLTSIASPAITLPSGGSPTLSFKYYLAHGDNAGSDDFLRISVVEDIPTGEQRTAVVFERRGSATDVDAAWATANASLNSFAGQTIRILIEAADHGAVSLLEAAVDDVVVSGNTTITPTPMPITPTPSPLVFADDFETEKGWSVNPNGSDTATAGRWERGTPEPVSYTEPSQASVVLQLDAASGNNDLVTGRLAGASAGDHDLDGGVSSIHSPAIVLPSGASLQLSLRYYLAHLNNASSDDYLRISIVEDIPTGGRHQTLVLEKRATATNMGATWASATADLSMYAGQMVRILIESADSGSSSLIEAAVDDIVITRN